MKLKSFKLSDSDLSKIIELKVHFSLVSEVEVIRRSVNMLYNAIQDNSNLSSIKVFESKDEWREDMPHVPDPRIQEIRKKAKDNMQSVEMVDTPLGRMSSSQARVMNLTNSEALAELNGTEVKKEDVDSDKIRVLRSRYPDATEEQIKYYLTLETDGDGNLIFE